ncbi:hypothetical protein AURDEDRAFT_175358 [Auricularia subglabra TFB-10046 SS5]|uniref:F-box domain-containing protein n=1 Tax=Auricularia subglabra (strain TFB-10046 / SS5) TaxID=717982 RepID=J0WRZ7_AURST|nr:hypothetical protein AURDEDRAFT_175358 [Auricularia subglabra TFB-10046 SS5]
MPPEMWAHVADYLTRDAVLSAMRTAARLREPISRRRPGYLEIYLPPNAPQTCTSRLATALDYADEADRTVYVMGSPHAIAGDVRLGQTLLERMDASKTRLIGLNITLPLALAPRLGDLVLKLERLQALHISFQRHWGNNGNALDLSHLLATKPPALRHVSLVCEWHPVTLPVDFIGFHDLQSVLLCGKTVDGAWPADWAATVASLAEHVPAINVQIQGAGVRKVDLAPLLRGLGGGPLHVAFPDTCAAPGYVMISNEDGSVVRRLQWGHGDAEDGLTGNIATQLGPVAVQVAVVHIDSVAMDEILIQQPAFPNLGRIVVHSLMGPNDTEELDLDSETAKERAERLDCGWKEMGFGSANEFIDYVRRAFGSTDAVRVELWCSHCGNLNALPPELFPGPFA